jgi:UDP-glucoronosyl and UDP-glucosyl transferase
MFEFTHFNLLTDESYLTNGYLETPIDWICGMQGIRLKDIPSFIRTTNCDDIMLNFDGGEAQNALKAQGLILNTFESLEHEVLLALRKRFPHLYTIGPLPLLVNKLQPSKLDQIGSNLWKEDVRCLEWLSVYKPRSVVYVNFGSITVMTAEQLSEFAWGLANSMHPFLWVIRPDLISGEKAILPAGFISQIKDRGLLASWCPQDKVLSHPSVGVFLTHCGWNSTLESICGGVPMICWPFFAEQPTNCRYVCVKWEIGLEIDTYVRRAEIESLVREAIEGKKGQDMKLKAMEWKEKAKEAVKQGNHSCKDFDKLVQFLLTGSK